MGGDRFLKDADADETFYNDDGFAAKGGRAAHHRAVLIAPQTKRRRRTMSVDDGRPISVARKVRWAKQTAAGESRTT